jgi:hypothetical protein
VGVWTPPSEEVPFWRDPEGRRATVSLALAARPAPQRAPVLHAHGEAIARIVGAAIAARLGGESARARALASHASRLCGELAGLWPAGSDRPLR